MEKDKAMEIFQNALHSQELVLEDIPQIDLYMDQVLTLFAPYITAEGGKPLTKAMVNNYSKEGLITPVKGKKYTAEQIVQILLVCTMKQSLAMEEIKDVMTALNYNELHLLEFYQEYTKQREEAKDKLTRVCQALLPKRDLVGRDAAMLVVLLSAMSGYLKKAAENLIESELMTLAPDKKKKHKEKLAKEIKAESLAIFL